MMQLQKGDWGYPTPKDQHADISFASTLSSEAAIE